MGLGPLGGADSRRLQCMKRKEKSMNNMFYIIGVVVVGLAVLGYFGLR
jgi:hypothetical protein